ncbi:hypothetical protein [Cellulosimicrobium marinum]|uniref:hypothetical protein n=1 Tax=Cellulosimicrobium marinum TaxID=1638992 RepID=UPI001E4889CE|nr:hypothetical protein [Cellulosimicrobium marinum]MCB7137808.1 hypothetical protein [Cellulosimicrobium marinum]
MSTDPAPTPPSDDDLPALDGVEIPDDLSGLTSGSAPELVALVTQIAGAEPLAAACSLAQVEADVVATDVGAVAVLRDRAGDAPAHAAAALTTLVKGVPLILVERRGEQLSMRRWADGAEGDVLAPGLVLGGAPEELEDLLVGTTALTDLPGVVASTSISRWKAMRLLTSAARRARKQ